jgi:hypothetical protein
MRIQARILRRKAVGTRRATRLVLPEVALALATQQHTPSTGRCYRCAVKRQMHGMAAWPQSSSFVRSSIVQPAMAVNISNQPLLLFGVDCFPHVIL